MFYHGITSDGVRFTIAGTYVPNPQLFDLGISLCSNRDPFVKKYGRDKAEGRLKKSIQKNERGKFRVNAGKINPDRIIKSFIEKCTAFNILDSKELKLTFHLT